MGERDVEAESQWVVEMKERFHRDERIFPPLVSLPKLSIYRISNYIKHFQPKAYTPQFVALGPYYRNINPQLSMIDEEKVEATRTFLRLLPGAKDITIEQLVASISSLVREIRGYYEETLEYEEQTLAWMFTVDGCFCVEFFRAMLRRTRKKQHFILFSKSAAYSSSTWWEIQQDIFKLENQIPLLVLTTILELEVKRPKLVAKRVTDMLRYAAEIPFNFPSKYLGSIVEREVNRHIIEDEYGSEVVRVRACHLLDLYRKIVDSLLTDSNPISQHHESRALRWIRTLCWTCTSWLDRSTMDCWNNLCSHLSGSTTTVEDDSYLLSAVELQKAGIKFKASSKGEVRFERRWFRHPILALPRIYIDEDTEPFVRNLMAFEERHVAGGSPERPVFCNFMVFINYLIESERDIGLLREHDIIKSARGSSQEIAVMFNTLCRGVLEDSGQFERIVRQVRRYYTNPVNAWINFFREGEQCLWAALKLVTIATLVQTVYTILQYYSGKNHK